MYEVEFVPLTLSRPYLPPAPDSWITPSALGGVAPEWLPCQGSMAPSVLLSSAPAHKQEQLGTLHNPTSITSRGQKYRLHRTTGCDGTGFV